MSRTVASRAGVGGSAKGDNRAKAGGAKAGPIFNSKTIDGYFRRSELPLHSLAFLLPMLVLFELGTYFHPSDPIAFRMLQIFFLQLGATGRFLPALLLVGILVSWHLIRRDPWRVRVETLWGMALESVLLSLPLIALGLSFARWHIHVPLYGNGEAWRDNTILSLGAGLYEELVFRLILMTLLVVILGDFLRMPGFWPGLLMVVISSVLFSMYHYLGHETFQWRSFAFRTVAGLYFAALFLTRGFGITCGCHISYDILVVAMQAWAIR
jgi:membrane protease YdiL (CAAX protease family)